jgi:hypothetical protein
LGRCTSKRPFTRFHDFRNDRQQRGRFATARRPISANSPPSNSSSDHEHTPSSSLTSTPHHSELLDRVRHFLGTPQVIHQDHESKRGFLSEKGLSDGEVQLLLREVVRVSCLFVFRKLTHHRTSNITTFVRPFLPPKNTNSLRSCPSSRRGCTPHLLHLILPAFSWACSRYFHGLWEAPLSCSSSITYVANTFLALVNPKPVYCSHSYTDQPLWPGQRFLLPRLTRSALARRSLKAHHGDLLTGLTASLQDLKEAQKFAYAGLPHPDPWEEVAPWGACKAMGDIVAAAESSKVRGTHGTLCAGVSRRGKQAVDG